MKQLYGKSELLDWLRCPGCGGKRERRYTCVICFKSGKIEEIKMPDA